MTIAELLDQVVTNFSTMTDWIINKLPIKADKPILTESTDNIVLCGKEYYLGEVGSSATDTITLSTEGIVMGEVPTWHFYFTAGSNSPMWGNGISIVWETEPSFTEGNLCEVSIQLINEIYVGFESERTLS